LWVFKVQAPAKHLDAQVFAQAGLSTKDAYLRLPAKYAAHRSTTAAADSHAGNKYTLRIRELRHARKKGGFACRVTGSVVALSIVRPRALRIFGRASDQKSRQT